MMDQITMDDVHALVGQIVVQQAINMKRVNAQMEALQQRIQQLEGEQAKERAPKKDK